ncbi:hypothetical protein HYQ46_007065 [Verticillium longisporum]|nr:hypothetical protein HYQ46_007065 [Verticillium longisporum]
MAQTNLRHLNSPGAPLSHGVARSDRDLRARLLLYEDGDPWNITAADNPEWLDRFKRDIGIVPLKTSVEHDGV